MKVYVYARNDGGTSVLYPNTKAAIEQNLRQPMTDEQYVEHVKKGIPSDAKFVREYDSTALPTDREFRDAWELPATPVVNPSPTNPPVTVNLGKAKGIQLTRLRLARDELFPGLDAKFMEALEKNDTAAKNTIAAQKQALRDITEPLKSLTPTTVDDIKKAFPKALKDKDIVAITAAATAATTTTPPATAPGNSANAKDK